MAELLIRGLGKAYAGRAVLHDVDLSVPSGALVAILGASGSGKTTLLRLICGFERPDAGTITVDIDDRQIPRDTTHQNGWDWIDQAYGVVGFFGSACTAASGSGKVTGVVTCRDQ